MSDLHLTPDQTEVPFRAPAPLPDLAPTLQDFGAHPSAKQTDELGQALRAGLGIGALALLPDLIADLRRSRDPDARLKFLAMAFKEGGYGTKEDKSGSMPVFHFNFVTGNGTVEMKAENIPEIDDIGFTETVHTKVDAINDDFLPAETEFRSVLELIEE